MRDYQKKKVYDWEDSLFENIQLPLLSPEESQAWINFIWANEGRISPPVLRIKELKTVAGRGGRFEIICGERYLNHHILTHELAHSLVDFQYLGKKFEKHGEIFVGLYAGLLVKYLKFPRNLLYKTLKESKIDFNGIG